MFCSTGSMADRRLTGVPDFKGPLMPQRILVVDDEAVARRFLERALTHEGYEVMLANDGEEALALLRSTKQKVHLVITDLVMPGMGGHAFALEVATLPSPPPVLYISAYDAPQGEMSKRFLQKPFKPDALVEAVRGLLPVSRRA